MVLSTPSFSNLMEKDIPIILLSEPTAQDTEAKGFALFAADYITKPFMRSVVSARIRTHLELTRYRDDLENRVKNQVSKLHKEIQVIHSDGSTLDVELNVCVLPYGRSLAALVFVRDIREPDARAGRNRISFLNKLSVLKFPRHCFPVRID